MGVLVNLIQSGMTTAFVPVFDGNHYEYWNVKMKTLLKAVDLWDIVETGIQQESPEEISSTSHEFEGESYATSSAAEYNSASWKQWMQMKDTTALHIIQNGLTVEIFPWIASATSSKEAWELLLVKSLGGPMFQARKLLDLKKEYENMKMCDAETIHRYTGRLMELVFRMKSCGWEVEDKEIVKKILSSLPLRFDEVLVEDAETLSISDLIDYLLVYEYNTKPVQKSLEESVIESVDVEESLQPELNSSRERLNSCLRERLNSSNVVTQVSKQTPSGIDEGEMERSVFLFLLLFLLLVLAIVCTFVLLILLSKK